MMLTDFVQQWVLHLLYVPKITYLLIFFCVAVSPESFGLLIHVWVNTFTAKHSSGRFHETIPYSQTLPRFCLHNF